ncbi:MAG: ribose-phosphate diphosphokinase [Candidatus Aenigmatarchaeota archaeon]
MPDFVVGNDDFGKILSKSLGCAYRQFVEEFYADGEPCPRINANYNELSGKHVVFAPRASQKPTRETIALYLHDCERVLGALTNKDLYNAGRVELVLPYFMLGRQDHNPRTDSNESVRMKDAGKDVGYAAIAAIYKALGADRIITFDPHFYRKEGIIRVSGIDVVSLSGVYALGRYFQGTDGDTVVVGPDMNASTLSTKLADILGAKSHSFPKKRISDTKVEIKEAYDAEGAHVILVDDILSTGGTIREAIDNLYGASSINVAFIHPVLPDVGYNRIMQLHKSGKIRDVVATDTINSEFSKASVIPELTKALMG